MKSLKTIRVQTTLGVIMGKEQVIDGRKAPRSSSHGHSFEKFRTGCKLMGLLHFFRLGEYKLETLQNKTGKDIFLPIVCSLQFSKTIDLSIFLTATWQQHTFSFRESWFVRDHSIFCWAWSKWRNPSDEIPATWPYSLCLYMVNDMELFTFQGNPFYF